ncbi:MAG: chemotaxis-specific protein-glutamate methyltransferase CheB [Acidobacteriota bacterium]
MSRGSRPRRLRVAVVDDSTFIRKAITRMLEDDDRLRVVGSASSGEELLTHLEDWAPDVVTLDLDMPGMGGLATLDRLTALRPTPTIILSTHSGEGAPLTIEALHRGATDFIDKQRYSLVDFDALRRALLEKIFEVTGYAADPEPTPRELPKPPAAALPDSSQAGSDSETDARFRLVVMGASTGGPPILQTILETLLVGAGDFRQAVPIAIVQHMPTGFTQAFAERLNAHLPCAVQEARDGEFLLPGHVYIARAGRHLRVGVEGEALRAEVSAEPKHLVHVPSVDVLFESAARAVGRRGLGVLLTGMGRDGAKGMAAMRAAGSHTFCQDEASSVVFGMPRAALALGAVSDVGSPTEIGQRLAHLLDLPG